MIEALDRQARLTSNQRKLIFAGTFGMTLEFLDYFLIGFILTFVAKPWGLTFAKSSVILLSSGVGAMVGALFFGWLADRIGRRRVFLATVALFTSGTGLLIFTPEQADLGFPYLAAMRFLIGLGAGGLYCVDLPLIQEFVPTAMRGRISGLVTASVPIGFLLGSALVAWAAPSIGWRGLMIVCVVLSLLCLLIRTWIPESPRWLLQAGRPEDARASIAWALRIRASAVPVATAMPATGPSRFADLFRFPRSVGVSWLTNLGTQTGYYGMALWTPTLIVEHLHVAPSRAAFYMVFITLAALAGRIVLSHLSETMGRRTVGALASGVAVAGTLAVAWSGTFGGDVATVFLACLALTYFFGEGVFCIVGPYAAEVWPSRLRATGMGSAYGVGGLGKIIGPLGLGLLLGTATATPGTSGISPQTAFMYFGFWYALACIAFLVLGFETRGRSIEALDAALDAPSSGSPAHPTTATSR